jgi:hypothetical protein
MSSEAARRPAVHDREVIGKVIKAAMVARFDYASANAERGITEGMANFGYGVTISNAEETDEIVSVIRPNNFIKYQVKDVTIKP